MILVNTDYISGKELEMLGLVKGSTIQSKNIGRDISHAGGRRAESLCGNDERSQRPCHPAYGGRSGKSGCGCYCKCPLLFRVRDAGGG